MLQPPLSQGTLAELESITPVEPMTTYSMNVPVSVADCADAGAATPIDASTPMDRTRRAPASRSMARCYARPRSRASRGQLDAPTVGKSGGGSGVGTLVDRMSVKV